MYVILHIAYCVYIILHIHVVYMHILDIIAIRPAVAKQMTGIVLVTLFECHMYQDQFNLLILVTRGSIETLWLLKN